MAGDWLKMDASTPEKGEVLAITAHMGWDDADMTVGKLFRLWRWFDQHTVDGNAASVTPALLDRIIGVSGFCEAVQKAGWLIITDGGVSLPKFDRHNGSTAKSRALTAKRVSKHKISDAKSNASSVSSSVTSALPREEKRREEESIGTKVPVPDGDEKVPNCPISEIVATYHATLPAHPRVRAFPDVAAKMLRSRWRESSDRQTLDWWREFFAYVGKSDFLAGRRTDFQADLLWLVRPTNFAKVVNGNYEAQL